jgi:hypothetical protein
VAGAVAGGGARRHTAQRILKAGMPAQLQEKISNGRMNQGWWLRIKSTILVVE